MQRLAGIAARFTPQVSIEPPDGLLLEIKPSINLFGGLRELCRRLRDACRADPVLIQVRAAPHFTLAPTALAALVAARAGARCFITDAGGAARQAQTAATRRVALARGTERAPRGHGRAHARRTHAPAARRIRPALRSRACSPISTGCWGVAPIRARASAPRSVIAACAISITKSRITNASCRRSRRLLHGARAFPARAPARHHRAAMPFSSLPRGADALHVAAGRARGQRGKIHAPAARTSRHAGPAGTGAALRAARRRAHASHRDQPATVVTGRTGPCERGRDAGAGRTSARAARRRGGVRHRRVPQHRPENAWCVAEPALETTTRECGHRDREDSAAAIE